MSEPTNLNEHAVLEEALNVLVDSTARLAGLLDNDGQPLDGDELALAWAAARRARVAAAGATHILCEQHRSHGAWGPGPAGPDLQDIAATLAGLRYVCPDDPAGARAEINLQHISDDQGIIDTDL